MGLIFVVRHRIFIHAHAKAMKLKNHGWVWLSLDEWITPTSSGMDKRLVVWSWIVSKSWWMNVGWNSKTHDTYIIDNNSDYVGWHAICMNETGKSSKWYKGGWMTFGWYLSYILDERIGHRDYNRYTIWMRREEWVDEWNIWMTKG